MNFIDISVPYSQSCYACLIILLRYVILEIQRKIFLIVGIPLVTEPDTFIYRYDELDLY
jgi:hypothetical protein